MRVHNIIPNDKIADYVDRILVIENDIFLTPFALPLYANGAPTLLFRSVKGNLENSDSTYLTLFGQTVSPGSLTLNEDFTLIAYFLKPHSLISLFGIPAFELTDRPIDLNLLSPQKTISLQESLLNCENIEDRIALLDNYIYGLVKEAKEISAPIKYASEKIASHYSKESLVNVQKELKISERTFERMFEKNIGISPNAYRRIRQFHSAFSDLNLGKYNNLSDIAFNHGYADQSHYIRTFKKFTKISPSEYLNYSTD
ncbi:helix-turn-helix transcriptional regulator [Niabella ginsengisoli]|uniref:Helix-turn-helix transcriptional regulator n=1 Tax=Niabella ginsengisoli TaxID=522298 RepID=A0ABS9SJ43_9BACT|nr:helix-turn-helix transcriptional regulator [Niabella ginsengisoli]MCH5598377.1 helix-turn-helix transcriptional regulator [Niabella ginsengisoli]